MTQDVEIGMSMHLRIAQTLYLIYMFFQTLILDWDYQCALLYGESKKGRNSTELTAVMFFQHQNQVIFLTTTLIVIVIN